jgi:serine phosphatase RsbU (regulator of sigma subunit)
MFGDERLAEVLARAAGSDARALADRVVDAVLDFQGGGIQDDLAVLVVRVPD